MHSRFVDALSMALPQLPPATVAERFRIALGCMNHAFTSADRASQPERSHAEWIDSLVAFAAAGLAGDSARSGRSEVSG